MENEKLFDRQEFIGFVQQRSQFETGWRPWSMLALFLSSALLPSFALKYFEENRLLFFYFGPVGVALWIGAFVKILGRFTRTPPQFLRCPVCKASAELANRFVMVATGRCGHCGEGVFRDCRPREIELAVEGERLFERTEFVNARGRKSTAIWLAAVPILWMVGFIGAARLARALPNLKVSPLLVICLNLATMVYISFGPYFLAKLWVWVMRHPFGHCPRCNEWIDGGNKLGIIASGRCGCCGETIFRGRAEPSNREEALP